MNNRGVFFPRKRVGCCSSISATNVGFLFFYDGVVFVRIGVGRKEGGSVSTHPVEWETKGFVVGGVAHGEQIRYSTVRIHLSTWDGPGAPYSKVWNLI